MRNTKELRTDKGITLVALIVTIIIMLILVIITINIAINGGLFNYAKKAKDDTEIASDKSILTQALMFVLSEDRYGKISEEKLQKKLDKLAGKEKTEVYDTGEGFEVFFKNSGLYYEVNNNGNIGDCKTTVKDEGIANVYVDENGNALDGVEKPYQINCIEDLVMLANAANGAGNYIDVDGNIVDVTELNTFSGKNIELTKTLNFNAPTSYADLNIKWSYDAEKDAYIIDKKSTTNLMEIITDKDGVGFVPIGIDTGSGYLQFAGNLDGKCYEIQNIYENRTGPAGLFRTLRNCTIKNIGVTGEIITSNNAGGINSRGSGFTFMNCYCLVDITANTGGGLSGSSGGQVTMINCYNGGSVNGGSGFIRFNDIGSVTNIINCYNVGEITDNRIYIFCL